MSTKRKVFSSAFKAKVAIEAIKGISSISELGRKYSVHPNAISNWKKQLLEGSPEIFSIKRGKNTDNPDKDKLYEEIGRLKVELDWLKKKYESLG